MAIRLSLSQDVGVHLRSVAPIRLCVCDLTQQARIQQRPPARPLCLVVSRLQRLGSIRLADSQIQPRLSNRLDHCLAVSPRQTPNHQEEGYSAPTQTLPFQRNSSSNLGLVSSDLMRRIVAPEQRAGRACLVGLWDRRRRKRRVKRGRRAEGCSVLSPLSRSSSNNNKAPGHHCSALRITRAGVVCSVVRLSPQAVCLAAPRNPLEAFSGQRLSHLNSKEACLGALRSRASRVRCSGNLSSSSSSSKPGPVCSGNPSSRANSNNPLTSSCLNPRPNRRFSEALTNPISSLTII